MTDKDFEFITDKIGIWFANLKLKSFRHTFDGDTYPSSALVTDYELFIAKLKKDIEFIPEEPVSEDLEEASENYSISDTNGYDKEALYTGFKEGAKWDREKIINKVVEWLKENVHKYADSFVDSFELCKDLKQIF